MNSAQNYIEPNLFLLIRSQKKGLTLRTLIEHLRMVEF